MCKLHAGVRRFVVSCEFARILPLDSRICIPPQLSLLAEHLVAQGNFSPELVL